MLTFIGICVGILTAIRIFDKIYYGVFGVLNYRGGRRNHIPFRLRVASKILGDDYQINKRAFSYNDYGEVDHNEPRAETCVSKEDEAQG